MKKIIDSAIKVFPAAFFIFVFLFGFTRAAYMDMLMDKPQQSAVKVWAPSFPVQLEKGIFSHSDPFHGNYWNVTSMSTFKKAFNEVPVMIFTEGLTVRYIATVGSVRFWTEANYSHEVDGMVTSVKYQKTGWLLVTISPSSTLSTVVFATILGICWLVPGAICFGVICLLYFTTFTGYEKGREDRRRRQVDETHLVPTV